jgi:putative transposase
MPKKLKRYYGYGELHFVTFSCYRRLPSLTSACARNLFVKELDEVRHGYDFLLVGYVLMPNHVHLLLSEPKKCSPSNLQEAVAGTHGSEIGASPITTEGDEMTVA